MIRDKKSGNNAYSAAGDDDINDVAAMGGVNLAEEANVREMFLKIVFLITNFVENFGVNRQCGLRDQILQR